MPKRRMGQKVISFYVSESVWRAIKRLCVNLGINQQRWLENLVITSLEKDLGEEILILSEGVRKTDLLNFTTELRELADRIDQGDILGGILNTTTQSMSSRFIKKLISNKINASDINLAAAELDIDSEELWNLVERCRVRELTS
jgi:hypothetical protein